MKARDRKNLSGQRVLIGGGDLPYLRKFRDDCCILLGAAREQLAEAQTERHARVVRKIVADIERWHARACRDVELLESTPIGWRP